MADLLWFDGFDDYNNTQKITGGYYNSDISSHGGTATITSSVGRGSSGALVCDTTNDTTNHDAGVTKTLASGSTTAYVGMAVKLTALPLSASRVCILGVEDANTPQCALAVNSDGTLSVWRGYVYGNVGSALLGTSSSSIVGNAFYYIELKITVHPTAGAVVVNVNGVNFLTLAGQNTRFTSNTSWNGITIGNRASFGLGGASGGSGTFGTMIFDDVYVHDGTGIYTGFLNDSSVGLILATGQGNYTDGTPSSAVAHYTLIDETPANDDTDYVDMGVVGNRESYQYVIPSTGHTIWAAALRPYMKKTDAGPRTVTDFVRNSGTNYDGAGVVAPSLASYTQGMFIRALDPSTGAGWSSGTKELGIKVVS